MKAIPDASALGGWRKSSYSENGAGACVEVAEGAVPSAVPVRDSKAPHGPALVFPTAGWSAFVTAVKDTDLPAR
ncbi:DUF397 domain-containing protein [Streptomyces johnsoniae]|uniref:DUF397 domain-containing protein n=1 Tax=Streptomyces johnsoniae TaxID=3075532 RepID=A0ABU2S126_9ACTN|nr:DUF397 domain-containing protein [Streptomyces sp. DSM 41886]MDT0441270.1 DUF397 domain-containing protein [Streptomyces sp. DSM 41886]